MAASDIELLRGAWAAFERGDIDAATELFGSGVQWYAADEPDAEGGCHNREEARAFISRALDDGVHTELLDICDAGEHRLVLILHAHLPADWGDRDPHGEIVTLSDGKVTEMVPTRPSRTRSPPRGMLPDPRASASARSGYRGPSCLGGHGVSA